MISPINVSFKGLKLIMTMDLIALMLTYVGPECHQSEPLTPASPPPAQSIQLTHSHLKHRR